jgi:hypothetical protein
MGQQQWYKDSGMQFSRRADRLFFPFFFTFPLVGYSATMRSTPALPARSGSRSIATPPPRSAR